MCAESLHKKFKPRKNMQHTFYIKLRVKWHPDLHIVPTVDYIDENTAAADDDGDGVDGDAYNAAGGDDGDVVDAFHLVTRTDTSLGLQVADQPLGVVYQLCLESRDKIVSH